MFQPTYTYLLINLYITSNQLIYISSNQLIYAVTSSQLTMVAVGIMVNKCLQNHDIRCQKSVNNKPLTLLDYDGSITHTFLQPACENHKYARGGCTTCLSVTTTQVLTRNIQDCSSTNSPTVNTSLLTCILTFEEYLPEYLAPY